MDSETLRTAQLFVEQGLSSLTSIVWTPSDLMVSKLTIQDLRYARENLDFLRVTLDPDLRNPDLLESLNKVLGSVDPDSIPDNVLLDVKKVVRIGFIQACRIYGLRAIETEEEAKVAKNRYWIVMSNMRYAGPGSKTLIEKMLYDSLLSEWERRQKLYRPGLQQSLILSSFF